VLRTFFSTHFGQIGIARILFPLVDDSRNPDRLATPAFGIVSLAEVE
jgi:hypothetical protein